MHSVFVLFLLMIISALIFIGFLLNGFIFLKNFTDWLRDRQLQAIDMIMASLGLVRIIHLAFYTFKTVFFLSHELLYFVKSYGVYVATTLAFVEFCSLWWGTVLCVFYCLKINNYSSRLFLKLKMRISGMVPWLLLGSMMVSLLSSLPYVWFKYLPDEENSTQIHMEIASENVFAQSKVFIFYAAYIAGSCVPFLIFCIAIFFLVLPLIKHTRNMSNNNTGVTKSKLDVLLGAIRNMISFLFFNILYIINGVLLPLSMQLHNDIFILSCCFFQASYPSLHSVVLIISNVKLKKSIIDALHCLK